MANWLKIMACKRSTADQRRDTAWKFTHYRFEHKVNDPALQESQSEQQAWIEGLRHEQFRVRAEAARLAEQAEHNRVREETAASVRSFQLHRAWLQEGPARGLGRQHRMTKVATGWIPSRSAQETRVGDIDEDTWDDTELLEQSGQETVVISNSPASPMGSQAEADEQRMGCGAQWAVNRPRTEPEWPAVVASQIPELTVQMFCQACMTYPVGTGLGWDQVHPRALTRLTARVLLQLVFCLLAADTSGQWPQLVGWVIIVHLPKPDGGRRPIGLIPFLPRIWSRTRRAIASKWEAQNSRAYLYGGAGKGAEVAAWRQAARAEIAAANADHYAQGLLVKAYERIPYWVLLREAKRLGYPIRLLRLSVATYRLLRVIRIDSAVSLTIPAIQGIVAGSGAATTEMRLLMIDVIDSALKKSHH